MKASLLHALLSHYTGSERLQIVKLWVLLVRRGRHLIGIDGGIDYLLFIIILGSFACKHRVLTSEHTTLSLPFDA